MSLELIAEHTINTLLLSGGHVLDAGCRDFKFARALADRGCKVIAVDADPTVEDPKIERVAYWNLALAVEGGQRHIVMTDEPQARHLGIAGANTRPVTAVTLRSVMEMFDIEAWDCVKLDIEGSEYGVLGSWPGPVARQISVEFHEHCFPQPQEVYDQILAHLGQWYDVVKHEKKCAFGCRTNFNYWDSLFVRR